MSKGKISGSQGRHMFNFLQYLQPDCPSSCTILHSNDNTLESRLFHVLILSLFFSLCNFSHFSECIMPSHCDFNLYFQWLKMISTFSGAYSSLVYLPLWSVSFTHFSLNFWSFLLLCRSILYIPDKGFAENIFSQSVASLLIFSFILCCVVLYWFTHL